MRDEDYRDFRMKRPVWVELGLWGLPNRASAWAFFWLSVAISLGCVAYGFINAWFFLGGMGLLSALWYYQAIRWEDRHGNWSGEKDRFDRALEQDDVAEAVRRLASDQRRWSSEQVQGLLARLTVIREQEGMDETKLRTLLARFRAGNPI